MESGDDQQSRYAERANVLMEELKKAIDQQQRCIQEKNNLIATLRRQNDVLLKEKTELRRQNADLIAQVASLSRRASLSMNSPFTLSRQNKIESMDTAGTVTPELPPRPSALKKVSETTNNDSDTDYEDADPAGMPVIPKKLSTTGRRSTIASSSLVSDQERSISVLSTTTDSSTESSVEVFPAASPTPSNTESDLNTTRTLPSKFTSTGQIGRFRVKFDSNFKEVDDFDGSPAKRGRLATVIGSKPTSGKSLRDGTRVDKRFPLLRRQNSFPRRDQGIIVQDLNYLSPDMEMRIQDMIQQAIAKKYGGIDKASHAATKIQKAYREYKIRKRFTEIRQQQQDTMVRRRAFSVKAPRGRRPSMIGPRKYRRDKSSPVVDCMQQVKATHQHITSRHLGAQSQVSRRELLTKKSPEHIPTSSESFKYTIEGVCEEETSTDANIEDSLKLPCSSNLPKSPSVFSELSGKKLQQMFPSHHQRLLAPEPVSAASLRKKTNVGVNTFNKKPTRGIQYLVYNSVLEDNPQDVANFLYSHYGLSKDKIGEFVGEIRNDFNIAVLECLVDFIDFSSKTIDEALRHFQTLFRMPGEAQKIDKIMQVFAQEYYKQNENGVIKSEDAAYVLAFATMMLHTDLHNPAIRRHMTKPDWLKMNRGTNDDEDYPPQFLLDIYDRISKTEFATGVDHTNDVLEVQKSIIGPGCPPLNNPQRRLVHKLEVTEVTNLQRKPLRQNKHRRMLFVFNDVFLVTKPTNARTPTYEYRQAWSLLNAQVLQFGTEHSPYKHGVCIQRTLEGTKYQCNCDSEQDRRVLMKYLEESIDELSEMEKDRIKQMDKKPTRKDIQNGKNHSKRDSLAGDLLTSMSISASVQDMRSIGSSVQDAWGVPDNKRSSKDSGFDSPRAASPSPSPIMSLPISNSSSPKPQSPNKSKQRATTPESRRMLVVPTEETDPHKLRSRSLTPTPEPKFSLYSSDKNSTLPTNNKKKGKKEKARVSVSATASGDTTPKKKGRGFRKSVI